MPLPLPNLDDRRWSDLVDEARAIIPRYSPEWTDHNVSDPGMTLIDLLAWVVEADLYRVNRITDRDRLKFLELVDRRPRRSVRPPRRWQSRRKPLVSTSSRPEPRSRLGRRGEVKRCRFGSSTN